MLLFMIERALTAVEHELGAVLQNDDLVVRIPDGFQGFQHVPFRVQHMHAALLAVHEENPAILGGAHVVHAVQGDAFYVRRGDGHFQQEGGGRGFYVAVKIVGVALIYVAAAVGRKGAGGKEQEQGQQCREFFLHIASPSLNPSCRRWTWFPARCSGKSRTRPPARSS